MGDGQVEDQAPAARSVVQVISDHVAHVAAFACVDVREGLLREC